MPELSGTDIDTGLSIVVNNQALKRRLLGLFYQVQCDFEQRLRDSRNDQDMDFALRVAHSLKGAAGNLGMKGIQSAAFALGITSIRSELFEGSVTRLPGRREYIRGS